MRKTFAISSFALLAVVSTALVATPAVATPTNYNATRAKVTPGKPATKRAQPAKKPAATRSTKPATSSKATKSVAPKPVVPAAKPAQQGQPGSAGSAGQAGSAGGKGQPGNAGQSGQSGLPPVSHNTMQGPPGPPGPAGPAGKFVPDTGPAELTFTFKPAYVLPSREAVWRGMVIGPDQKVHTTPPIDMKNHDAEPQVVTVRSPAPVGAYQIAFVLDEPSRNPSDLGTCEVSCDKLPGVTTYGPQSPLSDEGQVSVHTHVYAAQIHKR